MGVLTTSPRFAPAAAGGVTDSFNRTDTTSAIGNLDTGQAWNVLSGTWGISSNQGYASATNGAQNHVVVNSSLSDCSVQATMSTGFDGGLCFRAIDDNNLFVTSAQDGIVYRRTSGGFTNVMNMSSSFTSGDVMKATLSGTGVEIFKNGSSVGSFTDSQGSTATNHGLRVFAVAMRFDNFSVVA